MSGRRNPMDDALAASACRCGHGRGQHEHLRRGTDCGACGADKCPKFVAANRFAWLRGLRPTLPTRGRGTDAVVLEHPTTSVTPVEVAPAPEEKRRRRAGSS